MFRKPCRTSWALSPPPCFLVVYTNMVAWVMKISASLPSAPLIRIFLFLCPDCLDWSSSILILLQAISPQQGRLSWKGTPAGHCWEFVGCLLGRSAPVPLSFPRTRLAYYETGQDPTQFQLLFSNCPSTRSGEYFLAVFLFSGPSHTPLLPYAAWWMGLQRPEAKLRTAWVGGSQAIWCHADGYCGLCLPPPILVFMRIPRLANF